MENIPLNLSLSERSPDAEWQIDRPYRARLRLSDLSDEGGLCKADVDFGRLLSEAGVRGMIDPRSIVLAARDARNEVKRIPCRVSEMLCYEDRGTIHWTADQAHKDARWELYFDVIGDKRYAPSYTANVGFGDELMLNCDDPAPIEVPMHSAPLSVDWDGDGKVDVLVGSQYSNTIGMPWDGIFFFRNIGTNEKPFFDRPLRLRARGVEHELRWYSKTPVTDESGFISEYYLRFNLFDWFGAGRLDVITISLADEYIKMPPRCLMWVS